MDVRVSVWFNFLSFCLSCYSFGDELASPGKVLWMSAYTTVSCLFAVALLWILRVVTAESPQWVLGSLDRRPIEMGGPLSRANYANWTPMKRT